VLLLPLTLVTGSRAGLMLLGLALIATIFAFRGHLLPPRDSSPRTKLMVLLAALGCLIAIAVMAVWLSRAEAWERLLDIEIEDENRLSNLGTLLEMAQAYFPFGSGFGSFDPLFRYFEPDSELQLFYLNHAHNDLVELLITGGLGGALILIGFLAWIAIRAAAVLRAPAALPIQACARAGVIVIVILLLSSLVDYPLRTPLLALLFALSAGLISCERWQRVKAR
jgi:O-antigen ligase